MKYLNLTFLSMGLVTLPIIFYVIALQFIESLDSVYKLFVCYLAFALAIFLLGRNTHFEKIKPINKSQLVVIFYGFMTIYGIDKIVFTVFGGTGVSAFPLDKSSYIVNFISLVVLSPILEEIAFRGVLYERFKKESLKTLGMLISTLLWTLMHFSSEAGFSYYLAIFLSGLVFCYLVDKSNGLYLAIIVHMLVNLLHFYAMYSTG